MYEIFLLIIIIIMHSYLMHGIIERCFFNINIFVDKDSKEESDIEEQAFPGMEEGEREEQAESSSDQEQDEDEEEDMDYAQLEDSAPSAEEYSSQSDDDTEGNDSSSNIRYIVNLSSST